MDKKFAFVFAFFTLFCSVALVIGHLTSGFTRDGSFVATGARDALWRLSIAEELTHAFPPQIPGYAGELLKNYHFLYDLFVGTTSVLTRISVPNLYFHYSAFLSATLFVVAIYQLTYLLVGNRYFSLFGTLLTVFTGNLSYMLPFISSQYTFRFSSNVFMSDQPFDQSHNPFNLLAYAFFLSSLCFFVHWRKTKSKKIGIVMGICMSILPGLKIYGGILLFGAMSIMIVYYIFFEHRLYWYLLFPYALVMPFIFLIKGKGFSILSFSPGWLLVKMIEDRDRLFLTDMALREQYYRQAGNIPHLFVVKMEQLALYLIGNLNIRLLAFGVFLKKKFYTKISEESILIGVLILGGLLVPLFFNQRRSSYDSIQFTPYALLLLSIVASYVLYHIYIKSRKRLIIFYLFFLFLFLIAVPTNIFLLYSKINSPKYTIGKEEVDALFFLKNNTDINAVILADMDSNKIEHLYVSGLSGRRTYLQGMSLAEQTGVETQERKEKVQNFFSYDALQKEDQIKEKNKFLRNEKIQYIYLSDSGLGQRPLLDLLNLEIIFENEKAAVYRVL